MGERLQSVLRQVDTNLCAALEGYLQAPVLSEEIFSGEARLWEAMRYGLFNGGKRIRPFLTLQFGELFGVPREAAMRAAMAVEALHCYSLVHDDLPAMDDDDLRRGKPSLHKRFDEATAILVGDALQTLAFRILTEAHSNPRICLALVRRMAEAGGAYGMVAGQMTDMHMHGGNHDGVAGVSVTALTRLQRLKTGSLFEFACEAPAIMAQSGAETLASVRGYAHDLGLAFQMTDDYLDAVGDSESTGKTQGKDKRQNKITWIDLLGIERTQEQARILCAQAEAHLGAFGERANLLRALAQSLPDRKF